MSKFDNNIRGEVFKNAGQALIEKIQKVEEIDRQQIDSSLSDLKNKYYLRNRRRKLYIYSILASIIFLLVSLSISRFYLLYFCEHDNFAMSMLNNNLSFHAEDITLITQNDRIELSDQVVLKYKKNGCLQINKEDIAKKISVHNKQKINHIIVPRGKRATVVFSDGTSMCINSGSHICYLSEFDKDKREIFVEGEVFLEVAKDSKRPFFVRTKDLNVKVLGTIFNISAYKDDKTTSVVLVEGRVEVEQNSRKTTITPNEKFSVENGESIVDIVDVNEYISWKDYIMLLSEHKAGDVFERLSLYYGIHIDYEQQIALYPVSGKLDLKSGINNSLNVLTELLGIKYEINPDGSFRVFQ